MGPALAQAELAPRNSAAWSLTPTQRKGVLPMNRFACRFVALGLAAAGSTAFAAEPAKPQPVMMTDAQMDDVTAGAGLGGLGLVLQDSLNNWNIGSLGF